MTDGQQRRGVVGGAAVPHAPQFFTLPDTEDHEQVARVARTMSRIGDGLRKLAPDGVVIIANDHLDNFLLQCSPAFTVHRGPRASGSFAGREFGWPVASDVATDLVVSLQDQGFDPAVSLNASIGYEFGIPLTFMGFGQELPVIPIFVNSYLPPQPSPDRCYAFGRALARAAELCGHRLVVIASGGLSHYPGTDLYADPDRATDDRLLDRIRAGNLRVILDLDSAALDRTGNVEARSWLMLAGALGERVPSIVALEPSWHHNYGMVSWDGSVEQPEPEPLHYPVPQAAQLALYAALYALRSSREACAEHLRDAEALADRHGLEGAARKAFVTLDQERLAEAQVHPLLGFLARLEVGFARDVAG